MSHTDPTDKPTASAGQDASGSRSERPLTRGKWTYYGDGIIEYVYTPRVGKVQRETIEVVKKGFPDLVEVDVGRFDFEIYNHRGLWVRVMDEAWELLNRDAPLVWVIKIKGLPEERDARMNQQGSCFFIMVVTIIAVIMVLFVILMT